MRRTRYRRKAYRRRRRGFRRYRKSARAKIASINRRLATEVKKNDNVIGISQGNFTQLTDVGLNDWAYCYPVLDASMAQGTQMDDIIGEQIKMKYLYLGFHLQQLAVDQLPVTLRIMVVQDRNYREYTNGAPTAEEMFANLFGMSNITGPYRQYSDVCLLPYNPTQPGRFRIIRDFKMNTSPGWRADYYRKLTILQRHTNSHGKIYFGPATSTPSTTTYWTSPIGMFTPASTQAVGYYFNYQVTGSKPSDPNDPVVCGEKGPYTLIMDRPIPTITDEYWETVVTKMQFPYSGATVSAEDPADQDITYSTSRNGIYVLVLKQDSPSSTGSQTPNFTLSIQSRFAFYDN